MNESPLKRHGNQRIFADEKDQLHRYSAETSAAALEEYVSYQAKKDQKFARDALDRIARFEEPPEATVNREMERIQELLARLDETRQRMGDQIKDPVAALTMMFDTDPRVHEQYTKSLVADLRAHKMMIDQQASQAMRTLEILDQGLGAMKTGKSPGQEFLGLVGRFEAEAAQKAADANSVIGVDRKRFVETRERLKALADLRAAAEKSGK